MPDWVYEALESFVALMDLMAEGSYWDALLGLALALSGAVLSTVVHELGHALAAVVVGARVSEMRIGDVDDLTISMGRFRLRLGRLSQMADTSGYVMLDGRLPTPRALVFIALAGPLANVAAALAAATAAEHTTPMVTFQLAVWTLMNLLVAGANLVPSGDPDAPEEWSDGRRAAFAWPSRRTGWPRDTASADPHAATSVPPPAGRAGPSPTN